MEPRMKSPVIVLPGLREALIGMSKLTENCGVPRATLELVHGRVGQLNGCSVCVDMHARALKKMGESDQRIFALSVWRDTPYYTEPERAALALAESVTRLSDRSDAVPDAIWKAAAAHFDERAMSALLTNIALANLWNRLNVPTQQLSGEWLAQYI